MTDTSLRSNTPGSAVMQRCLDLQLAPRGRAARFFGFSPLGEEAWPWFRGALGEIEVGRELSRLGPAWTTLHAVPVGEADTDIDHVVIGPGGVFTINTKNHAGKAIWLADRTFMVNGQKTKHIPTALSEARGAAKRLLVDVTPLIVVVRPRQITRKAKPAVVVVSSRDLARWLRKLPTVLDPQAIAAIVARAEQRSIWHSSPVLPEPGHGERFAALVREVDAARRLRLLWGAVFALVVAAGALALAPLALNALLAQLSS